MSKNNLKTWNMVKQPPPNMLKPIGFGALKGKSDINPQWRMMAVTQAFGSVGHGWNYRIVNTWTESCTSGQVLCFAEVAVKTKIDGVWGEEFSGIGGSSIIDENKNGIKPNDDGYKKAVTDALGVAFKALGVAADIYFGNWDGSKYIDTASEAFEEVKYTTQEQADYLNEYASRGADKASNIQRALNEAGAGSISELTQPQAQMICDKIKKATS